MRVSVPSTETKCNECATESDSDNDRHSCGGMALSPEPISYVKYGHGREASGQSRASALQPVPPKDRASTAEEGSLPCLRLRSDEERCCSLDAVLGNVLKARCRCLGLILIASKTS